MLVSDPETTETSGDDPITLIAVEAGHGIHMLHIYNESAIAAEWQIDGTNWASFPSGAKALTIPFPPGTIMQNPLKLRRISGGTDVTGVSAVIT